MNLIDCCKRLLTPQTLKAMKLTFILLTGVFLQVGARGNAQNNVTYSGKNVKLETIFSAVEEQTGFAFFYNDRDLKKANPVTVDLKNIPLQEALTIILKNQPLTFSINGKTIVIKEKITLPNEDGGSEQLPPPPIDITGKVTDADGNPLSGATVKVKGTSKGTTTNNDGVFVLKGVDDNATLEISFVGYETYTVAVANKTAIVASLKVKPESLNEVVINKGYYTEQQRVSTGNVSRVTAKEIEKQPVNNPLLTLQGRIPGMVITQSNGLPGSGILVQIRGQNSIEKGTLPLYVIDGVPYYSDNLRNLQSSILGSSGVSGSGGSGSGGSGDRGGNPLSYINPSDIESISVLKDADATAIYGSRGANGVVLITTKKGKAGKMRIEANFQTGFGQVPKMIKLLNTKQYLEMRHEAFSNDFATPDPNKDFDLTFWDTTRYTNWQKELIGGTANYNHGQLSLSGGNSNTTYLVSGTYHKETTVFPGDLSNQQGSLHFNLNSTSADQKFRINFSTNYSVIDNHLLKLDFTKNAVSLAPNAPALYNSDGTLNWAPNTTLSTSGTWNNPLAQNANTLKSLTNGLVANTVLSYLILSGLEIKTSLGYNNLQTNERLIEPAIGKDPGLWSLLGNNLRTSRFSNNRRTSWIVEPQLLYNKNVSKGQLSFLIGTTIQQNKDEGQIVNGSGFSSDLLIGDLNSAAVLANGGMFSSQYKYDAVFTRLSYNWLDKYLINFTARRDGSSRYGPANRFHDFGATGVGWVFSKEKLIQNNLRFLSFGKIRASYGTTGNDGVGDYSFLDLYSSTGSGVPYQGTQGLQITQPYTPDLAWEETKKSEVGLELGFLKDRLNITASYYENKSSNQLIGFPVPLTTGFFSIKRNLDALVKNTGWEFTFNTINIDSKNFSWTSSFNIFWNNNKLAKIDSGSAYEKYRGLSLSGYPYFKFAGVNTTTGINQFENNKGQIVTDPVYGSDQISFIDNTPKFSGGFSNTIEFKNFQLDFLLQFVKQKGFDFLYNGLPGAFYGPGNVGNQPTTVLSRWQKAGDVSNIQAFNQDYFLYSAYEYAQLSDQSSIDLSFLKLKNVSLSWQIPNQWKQAALLQNCRLYIQGQNLLTISKYHGFDPETRSYTSLPPLRVITVGIQVGL